MRTLSQSLIIFVGLQLCDLVPWGRAALVDTRYGRQTLSFELINEKYMFQGYGKEQNSLVSNLQTLLM